MSKHTEGQRAIIRAKLRTLKVQTRRLGWHDCEKQVDAMLAREEAASEPKAKGDS